MPTILIQRGTDLVASERDSWDDRTVSFRRFMAIG